MVTPPNKRFIELDLWRGFSVIFMIVFHVFFVLDFYGVVKNEMSSGFFEIFGDFVRVSFLLLVGVSAAISYEKVFARTGSRFLAVLRQWKRGVIAGVCALIVSFATFLVVPDTYVRFGILHLIAFSIFVLAFFAGSKRGSFAFAIFSFILGYFLKDCRSLILPVCGNGAEALDYFSVFPWIGFAAIGIFIGRIFYIEGMSDFSAGIFRIFDPENFILNTISVMGRYSLLIYMLHIPIIIGMLVLFNVIFLSDVF